MNAFSIVGKITEMPVLKETTNGLKTCELPVRVRVTFQIQMVFMKMMIWLLKYGEDLQKR